MPGLRVAFVVLGEGRGGPPVAAMAHNHVFRQLALRDSPRPGHLRRAVLAFRNRTGRAPAIVVEAIERAAHGGGRGGARGR